MQPDRTPATLSERLDAMAERLRAATSPDTQLAALLPCEPAVGAVAVACWEHVDRTSSMSLHALPATPDHAPHTLDDDIALREALVLLAMVEAMEDLASFDDVPRLRHELATLAWLDADAGTTAAAHRAAADDALAHVQALDPGNAPRIARTQQLDALSAALRSLDDAWSQLEQTCDGWVATLDETAAADTAVRARVDHLGRTLSAARLGPLRRTPSSVLYEARAAGTDLHRDVTSTRA